MFPSAVFPGQCATARWCAVEKSNSCRFVHVLVHESEVSSCFYLCEQHAVTVGCNVLTLDSSS